MKIRDRIKELRRVKASDLLPNPKNWRTHPKQQREALQGVLAEIGYADALLARETSQGLQLIDGHLRAETTPDQEVPVLILDVTEAEASKLLATLDPMAALAEVDADKLDEILREVETGNEAVAKMLEDLATDAGLLVGADETEQGNAGEDATPVRWGVYVDCKDEQHQKLLLETLNEQGYTCRGIIA